MSIHKLTAGTGYDYLTRQVAANDVTGLQGASLASYYTEQGETPGVWTGSGMAGIEGLDAGDLVQAEQMRALFGHGFHPLARVVDAEAAVPPDLMLGRRFKVYSPDIPPFQIEVARRIERFNAERGLPVRARTTLDEQAAIRSEVAREYFVREFGREPSDERELSASVAKHSRPQTTAVAGYDLTFSPVKSVSALWAVAAPDLAAKIEMAHNAAVKDALSFVEREALFTRTGTDGVRQVETQGMVAVSFTHRDSRAGDPDLHTHVAVANKVQTEDGRWLSIDGRVLFKATVAASERYNTALEKHLNDSLGIRFAERAGTDPRKRPIREIVGVDQRLSDVWSKRRADIDTRRAQLATKFQREHGRPPTPIEAIQLSQQATLETREAKHEPRTLAEQRTVWHSEAIRVLGSNEAIAKMVDTAVSPMGPEQSQQVTADWISSAGRHIVSELSARRATWQTNHVRAEALRIVRRAAVKAEQVDEVAELIVDVALSDGSVLIATDRDRVHEPDILRRSSGESVYSIAGSDTFTSVEVLGAETRIVEQAGHRDGRAIPHESVGIALLESAANGIELNDGQAALVRAMATSGARVQLAIAAAGTGKTTAMSVLTKAWNASGGTVLGLAPSAAAAAQLRDATGAHTDTLAKFVDGIDKGYDTLTKLVNPETLVLIDEAGMADTISLSKAVDAICARGGSVRLMGDDQQLAAIGAGGVLRDITRVHGAERLSELMRFRDPAEGGATLALRDGKPEALGFYLDNQRVHVGDLANLTDAVFVAWSSDRQSGKDSIMLAPTRELVRDLNERARAARLAAISGRAGLAARLSDGLDASAGDTILTRKNERKLAISATDWVKNGDRWQVLAVAESGDLQVRHTESGLRTVLPSGYVRRHVELGYASTVHTAQGVSVDSMHGLVTGSEDRQSFYTMMTRGKEANHVYLVTSPDGDEHSIATPEALQPSTASDVLEGILRRDGSAKSATTVAAEAEAPALMLGRAVARYTDALGVAAGDILGGERVEQMTARLLELVPGIDLEPAWPVLQAHLLLDSVQGRDPLAFVESSVQRYPLDGVKDRAAVLMWRLDPKGLRGSSAGPLPWIPRVPAQVSANEKWGPYLAERAELVAHLASQVASAAAADPVLPEWASQGSSRPDPGVLGEVAVWRAATTVDDSDRRPTGPRQLQVAASKYQSDLLSRLGHGRSPALEEWGHVLDVIHPRRDEFTPLLAERLAAMSRVGIDAAGLLRTVVAEGPLPDDHVPAALWWRISRHLSPAVADSAKELSSPGTIGWTGQLVDLVGARLAREIVTSPVWPTLVSSVEQAVARGWTMESLLSMSSTLDGNDVDLAQALIWHISILTDPQAGAERLDVLLDPPPSDLDEVWTPPEEERGLISADPNEDLWLEAQLLRSNRPGLVASDSLLDRQNARAYEWDQASVPGDRIFVLNEAAAQFYESGLEESWVSVYLLERFGVNLAGDDRFRPGYAPAGWSVLVDHLRREYGASDEELVASGLAKVSSRGSLIDVFRDRAVLPIISEGNILGFVGRRNPSVADDPKNGPKYLNSPETVVFTKSAQLYGVSHVEHAAGALPVVVEGPMDAIAVTIATGGAFVGVAPLGTSLTEEQSLQVGKMHESPLVALDGDLAGRVAAERAWWQLARFDVEPRFVDWGEGGDPSALLEAEGTTAVRARLFEAGSLASELISERIGHIEDPHAAVTDAAQVVVTAPVEQWDRLVDDVAEASGVSHDEVRAVVGAEAKVLTQRNDRYFEDRLGESSQVRRRLETGSDATPEARWARLARNLDPRLTESEGWSRTARELDRLDAQGVNVDQFVRRSLKARPLSNRPAYDLQQRARQRLHGRHLNAHPQASMTSGMRPSVDPKKPAMPEVRGPER